MDIPLNQIPDGYTFVTKDMDGSVSCHTEEPKSHAGVWVSNADEQHLCEVQPPQNWRNEIYLFNGHELIPVEETLDIPIFLRRQAG